MLRFDIVFPECVTQAYAKAKKKKVFVSDYPTESRKTQRV